MGGVYNASAEEARETLESNRDADWRGRSVMKEIFLGSLHVDWIDPFPETELSPEFRAFYDQFSNFLSTEVDAVQIDTTGEIPDRVLEGLKRLGCFGMKIPKSFGGLGFNQVEYARALELLGSHDANLAALLSAHQSIGLPQPLMLFGNDAQKAFWLPRCAKGAISAFALTEPDVGSDPARMTTICTTNANGDYVLNGTKLWCTNGTCADVMIVMAAHPQTEGEQKKRISAFIVEGRAPGIQVTHRCRFMGLKALLNARIELKDVVVPKENLLGKEGDGLRIALRTLNTGRLSLPAAALGGSRTYTAAAREFAARRVQWGAPVGRHEAVAHKLADLAATSYAMETLARLASELAMRNGYDIRLEAAAAKEYVSVRGWEGLDDAIQVRGGRGYESETSLAARGEAPIGLERMMRDARINRIFEGSSEIMHLFMAREALDRHLEVAWDLIDPKSPIGKKLAAIPRILAFYALWYPKLWLGWGWFRYGQFGALARHLRFAERASRKLARNVFHGMVWHGAKLEKRQGFLFRAVDIAMEILVMAAVVTRTQKLTASKDAHAAATAQIADLHCRNARRRIERSFHELWHNDDAAKYQAGIAVLEGEHTWVERDVRLPEAPGTTKAQAAK